MNKRILAIVGAAVLALLAVIGMVIYAQGADQRALRGTESVNVLQVITPIEAGTPASEVAASVEMTQIPRAALVGDAIDTLDAVSGQVTSTDLVVGDQLTSQKFASPDDIDTPTSVPEGMQSLSFPLTDDRAVGGKLQVGDEVGVLISYGSGSVVAPPLNRILVVGVDTPPLGDATGGSSKMITVAVDTENAEKIAHGLEFGTLRLTLQNEDTNTRGGRPITQEDIAR